LNLIDATNIDLSFNNLSGSIPSDLGSQSISIRQLHLSLDRNNFTSTIPETLSITGAGALVSLYLSDNMLTRGLPTLWAEEDKDATSTTDTVNVENNLLTENMDKEVCNLSICDRGQMVELTADCEICGCCPLSANCWEKGRQASRLRKN
jgi:hypothetical protein